MLQLCLDSVFEQVQFCNMGFMHSCTFAIVHNCSLHTCANQVIALQSIRGMDIDLHADLLRAVKQGEGTCGAVHFCRRYYNG